MDREKLKNEKCEIIELRKKKPKKIKEEIKLISIGDMMEQIFFGEESENQK